METEWIAYNFMLIVSTVRNLMQIFNNAAGSVPVLGRPHGRQADKDGEDATSYCSQFEVLILYFIQNSI